MAVTITYFVHAATSESEKKLASGWSDPSLSSAGIEQATNLGKQIKNRKFDAVFSSDLKRAIESANLSFTGIALIIPDKRLRECNYGKLNAQPSVMVEKVVSNYIMERYPEGESCEDVKLRMADFLEFLKNSYDGKSIALMSHKTPQFALDVLLKNKTWQQAFTEDWRKTGAWQPGWDYILK
jgi:broad specificity phosphatase PhoE